MATIVSENAKQIRDPMIVKFALQITEDAQITSFTPTSDYKSWDDTLSNVTWPMRVLADLQDEGFLLDGTAEWYEEKSPSATNGKLGLRSNEGETVTLQITGNKVINNITVKTEGVATIKVGSTSYTATGIDYISVQSQTFTMQFIPDKEHGRAFIDYIIPGALFDINNENLVRATLALRCNLDPFATTLEASEIEIQMYYPNDLGDMFKYVNNDWPVTYTAGYTDQMSPERRFYLSEPAVWKDRILTIKAVDSVPKLDQVVKQGSPDLVTLDWMRGFDETLAWGWQTKIESLIPQVKVYTGSFDNSIGDIAIRKECTVRDFLQRLMSLTANLAPAWRLAFVDAGIPAFFSGDYYTMRWTVKEEDLANISMQKPQNVAKITTGSNEKYDETMTPGVGWMKGEPLQTEVGAIFSDNYNGGYATQAFARVEDGATDKKASVISFTPTETTYKSNHTTDKMVCWHTSLIPSGGVTEYTNPNGLGGETVTYEPILIGRGNLGNGVDIFTPKNLFATNRNTIQFDFKGDPRWQPHDFLTIKRLDGTDMKTRIASIELKHEGGGTYATVVAQMSNQ